MILKDEHVIVTEGVVRNRTLFGVCVVDQRDRERNPDAAMFIVGHEGRWIKGGTITTRTTAFAVIGPQNNHFSWVSHDGQVRVVGGGADITEQITLESNAPIVALDVVNGEPYALGMGRQVYVRKGPDEWVPLHGEALAPDGHLSGFQCLAQGHAPNTLIAAGWKGEIWSFDGEQWTQEQSPTDAILSCAVRTTTKEVVLGGQRGTLVRGSAGRGWELATTGSVVDDLSSIVEYRGELYTSSESSIYRIASDGLVPLTIELDGYQGTHRRLTVADDVMYSFGARDILVLDGNNWHRVPTE